MFNKSPLILAIGLAIAAQAGAAITVEPGDGTTNISGSIESQEDFNKIFSSEPSGEDLHYTFKDNVFTTSNGGTGWPGDKDVIRNGGKITLISVAEGDFIEASRFELRNMAELTITKTSRDGAIFKNQGFNGDIRLGELSHTQQDRYPHLEEQVLEHMTLTNKGGSVFDLEGAPIDPERNITQRISLGADHYTFVSEDENSATIRIINYQNIGDDTNEPIRAGFMLDIFADENVPTDATIKGVKTAIVLDNTAMQTVASTVDITGAFLLENNAHSIFGVYSYDDEDHVNFMPEGFFDGEAYTDPAKLASLTDSFYAREDGTWYNTNWSLKGTDKSDATLTLDDSHIIVYSENINIKTGKAEAPALNLQGESTAAFLSKTAMTVSGKTLIGADAAMGVNSKGSFNFDNQISNSGSLLIVAASMTGSGENADVTTESGATTTIKTSGTATVGTVANNGGIFTMDAGKLVTTKALSLTQGTNTLNLKGAEFGADVTLSGANTKVSVAEGALSAKKISVTDGATLNLTPSSGSTVTADIAASNGASVDMQLAQGSAFKGTVTSEGDKGVSVGLNAGATMALTGDSSISNLTNKGGTLDLGEAQLDAATVDMQSKQLNLKATDLEKAKLSVATMTTADDGQVNVNVDLMNADGKVPATPEEVAEAAAGLISVEKTQNKAGDTVEPKILLTTQDGVYETESVTDGQGKVSGVKVYNDQVITSMRDVATTQMMAWRTQINDVNKRMGDLRTYGDHAFGGWARVYGAKTKLKDSDMSTKANTVQVGFDTKVSNNFYFGVTALYSDGESRIPTGTSDDKSYGFGVYGGWMADNGQFADVIIKQFRVNSDFDLRYRNGTLSTAEYSAWGTSISAEYGWRLGLTESNRFWIEPQAEISYGHLGGDTYTTSAGVVTEQDSMNSLIGRVGVALGTTFDKGSAYVKASVAHDWDGETSVTVKRNSTSTMEQDLGGTWGEFALGGTFNFTKNFAGYAEFQTTTGSKVKSPYQWNLGARYMF